MQVLAGVIGGTGVGERLAELGGRAVHVPTRFGLMRCHITHIAGHQIACIERHAAGHKLPPHLVNYRAIAEGLRLLGARYCLATAAVGSLKSDLSPGDFALCSDFIDLTGRNVTRFDSRVEHTDFSEPMGTKSRQALAAALDRHGIKHKQRAIYACTNGPRYETPHEVKCCAELGADVVGMTAASEAIAMREADIDYACLAIITNAAAGLTPGHLSHEEVSAQMKVSSEKALQVLTGAMEQLK